MDISWTEQHIKDREIKPNFYSIIGEIFILWILMACNLLGII